MASSPARLFHGTWRQHSIRTLARLLSVLLVTSCLINISYLGRHLGVQHPQDQHPASPLSSIQQYTLKDRPRHRAVAPSDPLETPKNISLPVVFVDDTFSAEDASYSVSESEDEEEKEIIEKDKEEAQVNVTNSSASADRLDADNATMDEQDAVAAAVAVSDAEETENEDENEEPEQTDDESDGSITLRLVDILASNITELADKRRVLSLLLDAGIESLDLATIRDLPDWKQVSSLYYPSGRRPVIYGLESCDIYRRTVDMDDRYLGTAGLFNTGTNALSFLLRENIIMQKKAQWQVPWSKHRLLRISDNHTAPNMHHFNRRHVLPIVIIKDIFIWLQSMCRSPYEARWKHWEAHCPNLIPDQGDHEHFPILQGHKTVPVKVKFSGNQTLYWDSLVSMYNDWYREYYDTSFPRLMVRFEDLLFAPEELLQAIADCVGAELAPTIVYNTESSKDHGSQTNLVGAMIKTGTGHGRSRNMTASDITYVNEMLDEKLRMSFDYTPVDVSLPLPEEAAQVQ